jgi:hypothetical protein
VLFAMISATMPRAGRIRTYTSGCARNQNRCCQSSALPPPATSSTWPLMTRPLGRKKLVLATRSISCMIAAASSGGKARSSRKAVTNCAHTKNGNRKKVSPFARSWIVVVMKLIAPSSDEVMRKIIPTSHHVWPACDAREGRVGGPSGLRGAAGDEEAGEHDDAAEEEEPVARHVEPRKRHVRGSDLEREHEVAEPSDGERHHPEEDHDGAVHGAELVVEVGEHRAARHPRFAEQPAQERQRAARVGQLIAQEHDEREAEEQEQQTRDGVLDADHLVVHREDVGAPEAERLVMGVVRDVRLGSDDGPRLAHAASLRIATSRRVW